MSGDCPRQHDATRDLSVRSPMSDVDAVPPEGVGRCRRPSQRPGGGGTGAGAAWTSAQRALTRLRESPGTGGTVVRAGAAGTISATPPSSSSSSSSSLPSTGGVPGKSRDP